MNKLSIKSIIILLTVLIFFSGCREERFLKEKYNESITFKNKSSETIKSLKMWGGSRIDSQNSKIWNWENITPGETIEVTFNIKRDIGEPEGSIYYEAIFNNNDTTFSGQYYSNWQLVYSGNISILKDKFLLEESEK